MVKEKYDNEFITVPVFDAGKTLDKNYKFKELDDILKQIPFNLISVPVYGYRNELYNDNTKRGNFIAGYVSKYISESHEMEVCIYGKYKDLLDFKDPIIYPRIALVKGVVVSVTGLDYCTSAYYRVLGR